MRWRPWDPSCLRESPRPCKADRRGEPVNGNLVVLGVALLGWLLLFLYLVRLERRIKELERR